LLTVRGELGKLLEQLRKEGKIGSSLDAEVDLFVPTEWLDRYGAVKDELRFFFITSELNLRSDKELHFDVRPSDKRKCIRCWHHRPDVGVKPDHPDICGRCVTNVEGPGEQRKFA